MIPFLPSLLSQKLPVIQLPKINFNWIFSDMDKQQQSRWPFFALYLKDKGFDPKDPFDKCDFDRGPFAQNVINTVKSYKESNRGAVIGIDAGWGHGKSSFMDMLGAKIDHTEPDLTVIRFNAWETDFASDPLLAFIACFEQELGIDKNKQSGEFFRLASKSIAFDVIKKGSGIDLDKIESQYLNKAYTSFLEQRDDFKKFKDKLTELAKENGQLVILIDELDRCRPSYAIELLENIKHFFNVPGVVFLLAVNRNQLENAFQHVYGTKAGEEGEAYFEKFVDLFLDLPDPEFQPLAKVLYQKSGLDKQLKKNFFFENQTSIEDTFAFWVQRTVEYTKLKRSHPEKQGVALQSYETTPREIEKIIQETFKVLRMNDKFMTQWHLYITFLLVYLKSKRIMEIKYFDFQFDGEKFDKALGFDLTTSLMPPDLGVNNQQTYLRRLLVKKCSHDSEFIGQLQYAFILAFWGHKDPYTMQETRPSMKKYNFGPYIEKFFRGNSDKRIGQSFPIEPQFFPSGPFANELMRAINRTFKFDDENQEEKAS